MMRCEVNFQVADPEAFGLLAARWVLHGAQVLAPGPLNEVLANESVPKGRVTSGKSCGPAGAKWGFVAITRYGKTGPRQTGKVIDEGSLAWAQKEAAKGVAGLALGLNVLDSSGMPGERIIRFEGQMVEGSSTWCQVWFEAPETDLLGPGRQAVWLEFLRGFCEDVNPSYGQVSYDYGVRLVTALEAVTGPPWTTSDRAVVNSRDALRGYDWLTVCADELAAQLGGVEGLRGTGAFSEVERLGAGGVWLLATEQYEEYGGQHVEAVWRALAPVLLKGTPSRERAESSEYPFRLVFRDAAEA
jgi:hypothetical protein